MWRSLLLLTACLLFGGCEEYNSDNIFLQAGQQAVDIAPAGTLEFEYPFQGSPN